MHQALVEEWANGLATLSAPYLSSLLADKSSPAAVREDAAPGSRQPNKKRRVLGSISHNAAALPRRKQPRMPSRSGAASGRASPPKGQRADTGSGMPPPPGRLTRSQTLDQTALIRSPFEHAPLAMRPTGILRPPSRPPSAPSSAAGVASPPSAGPSERGAPSAGGRSRTSSPSKGMMGRKMQLAGIYDGDAADAKRLMDGPARDLADALDGVAAGVDVVPGAVAERVRAALEAHGASKLRPFNVSKGGGPVEAEASFPELLELARAEELVVQSLRCFKIGANEAMWNCAVHYSLLSLAAKPFEGSLDVLGVTTANLAAEYLPHTPDGESQIDPRRIDFVAHLLPPPALDDLVVAHLSRTGAQSINHTALECLMRLPIALSVETKALERTVEEAKAQLATWAGAQLNRLRAVVDGARDVAAEGGGEVAGEEGGDGGVDDAEMEDKARQGAKKYTLPTLPLVLVRAEEWYVHFAAADGKGEGLALMQPLRLGETTSLLGVYKVLAGLRACYGWAVGPYAEWFERVLKGKV